MASSLRASRRRPWCRQSMRCPSLQQATPTARCLAACQLVGPARTRHRPCHVKGPACTVGAMLRPASGQVSLDPFALVHPCCCAMGGPTTRWFVVFQSVDSQDLLGPATSSVFQPGAALLCGVFLDERCQTAHIKGCTVVVQWLPADRLLACMPPSCQRAPLLPQVSATTYNEGSSRSHTILRLTIESSERPDPDAPPSQHVARTLSVLNLIDLAGT